MYYFVIYRHFLENYNFTFNIRFIDSVTLTFWSCNSDFLFIKSIFTGIYSCINTKFYYYISVLSNVICFLSFLFKLLTVLQITYILGIYDVRIKMLIIFNI